MLANHSFFCQNCHVDKPILLSKAYINDPEIQMIFSVSVACGRTHTLVLTNSGQVYSCGNNDHNQLGHSNIQTRFRKFCILINKK